ncbi:tax1-binding protein 1 homolog B-like isoform X2 [Pomacea canaliculata]|uniref:tax1-binding protein 1 homolog B-like isoform X2 n=1 Tax=Pomacea canaliculata TaxID=400727 RepID=UPI000D7278EC|nr:tax1-binding protein 1 homolog B-like isoform X2 [Pomacea canaliculata]
MKVLVKDDENGQLEVQVSVTTMENSGPLEGSSPETPARHSEFAAVVFHEIAEMYPTDSDVVCSYTLTENITASPRDWVGLYKVGWLTPRDYVYYEWAPTPSLAESGSSVGAKASIVFPENRLPKDDGEFYQFCYVSQSGTIRGASTPFQFKQPCAEEFVEICDSDNEMLVIRHKKKYLEEEISKITTRLHAMEQERESLIKKLHRYHLAEEETNAKLAELTSKLTEMTSATKDMSIAHDEVKEKLALSEKERERLEMLLHEKDAKIHEYQQEIKTLTAAKDELEGLNRSLINEMDSYKLQVAESQAIATSHLKEIEVLSQELDDLQKRLSLCVPVSEKEAVDANIKQLEMKINAEVARVTELKQQSCTDRVTIQTLETQVQNLEDQLQAAHEMKRMMSIELESFHLAQAKLSSDLENTKEENHALKEQLALVEAGFTDELKQLRIEQTLREKELESHSEKIQLTEEENTKLKEQIKELEQVGQRSQEGALYALQKVNSCLKDRYEKLKIQLEEKDKELAAVHRQNKQSRVEMAKENKDLKERIAMCTEEYKTLLLETGRLQRKLEKHYKAKAVEYKTEKISLVAASPEDQTPNSTTLEVSPRQIKKEKYKRLYQEEKNKGEMMQNHYYEQLSRKDAEIDKVRKTAAEQREIFEQQIRILEKCIAEKDAHITDLNNQLRDLKVEEKSRTEAQSGHSASCHGSNYVQGDHSNGYEDHFLDAAGGSRRERGPAFYYIPTTECEQEEVGACGSTASSNSTDGNGNQSSWELPPPLQPQVLPSAKLAAVKQQIGCSSYPEYDEACHDLLFEDAAPDVIPQCEDERFMDAIGEGMKICPVCEMHINTAEGLDSEFAEHVVGHFGRLCPICKYQADDSMPLEDFKEHVNTCCDSNGPGSRK